MFCEKYHNYISNVEDSLVKQLSVDQSPQTYKLA